MKTDQLPGRPLAGIHARFPGLKGVSVVDFSKLLPGPFATQILADLGCKVLKVELPHFPDEARVMPPLIDGVGSVYTMVNQGKKLLSLDFRKPQGLKRMYRILKNADVLLEGFRPGLMERVGLGYEKLKTINPRLVYCSLVGYDPACALARKAGHDINFQAVSGFLGLGNSEGRIAYPANTVADLSGSLGAAVAILAALVERQATGRGRAVTVSMADALHSLLAIPLGERLATGQDPVLGGNWWSGNHPFYRLYAAADGRYLAVGALERNYSIALLDALGLAQYREKVVISNEEERRAMTQVLADVFASATLDQWLERLKDKDVCVTPVYSLGEALKARSESKARGCGEAKPRRRSKPARG